VTRLDLFVPQWQDSGHTNEIYRGSFALRSMVDEEVDFHDIRVNENDSLVTEHGVYGYRVILAQLGQIRSSLDRFTPERVFTLGGGCGVEVPVVSYLKGRYGRLRLYWFDAHGDINSPESSPSKYFHGMPLRFLLEKLDTEGISELSPFIVRPEDVLLIGTRDLDEPERAYIQKNHIRMLTPLQCSDTISLEHAFEGSALESCAYVHIDLDCIDPTEFQNVKCPAKGGLSIATIDQLIGKVEQTATVVGLSILENMETDREELEKLRPLISHALKL